VPRILFLTHNFPPKLGGIESVVEHVHAALSEIGEVTVLAQAAPDCHGDPPNVLRPSRPGLLRYLASAWLTGRRLMKESGFDVVLSGSALTALPAVRLARRGRARSAVMAHGLDVVHRSFIYQRALRHALRRADRVFANSAAVRTEAVARGARPGQTRIIHPGCDAGRFECGDVDAFRARWGLKAGGVILSAGRLVERKGVGWFVRECLPLIVERVPDAALLVAGGEPEGALVHRGGEQSAILEAAAAAGMADRVIVTGRLSDDEMTAAFRAADMFVLPAVSLRGDMEGFGIVLLEAAAAGLPVVASSLGGIPDAVADGVTGVLVPPHEPGTMAAVIADMLDDAGRRGQLGEAGRQRVMDELTWEIIGKQYQDAVLELC
jgi:phosphatidyl-myo-inositol dimannoside synthase